MQDATRATRLTSTRSQILDRIRLVKCAPNLSPSHRLVLRSLVDYFGNRDECWPAVSTLASECGLSVRHCRRILRDLERSGWITHRPRFRANGSQTSSVIEWVNSPRTSTSAPPDIHVRPIETFKENPAEQHYAACGLLVVSEATTPEPTVVMPETPETAPTSTTPEPTPETPQSTPEATAVTPEAETTPAATTPATTTPEPTPEAEATPAARVSPRWIQIQNETFSDPHQAARVYCMAVAGGLITPSESDRLAFFAAWCAVSRKARGGNARNPGGMMRFLLSNPKALRAYPTAPDETKAREAIRRLYQPPRPAVSTYNPFRPVDERD